MPNNAGEYCGDEVRNLQRNWQAILTRDIKNNEFLLKITCNPSYHSFRTVGYTKLLFSYIAE